VANEVKIKVTSDQRGANMDAAKRESAGLRRQVESDAAAMKAASEKLEAARKKEQDTAGKVRVAELKLQETRENSKAKASQLAAAEERFATAQRNSTAAMKAGADAAELLNAAREKANAAPADEGGKSGPTFDVSKSFLNKGQLLSEAKSVGIQAGAVIAGALGAGLSTVAAAGVFVGIAAAAQSSNADVANAYASLWNQVKAGAQDASATLSGNFIQGAEKLGRTFNALKPQMTEAFTAAKPVVDDLFDGIDRGARAVMPGLVTATKAASQASGGLADMMESAGRGVSNFFTESSQGAAAGGQAFQDFGQIVERLGSFAGRILADLANSSGSVFPQLVGAVDAAATAVENLAHVALPSLAGGTGLVLSGFTMLLTLANSLISALGPMAPVISTVASSLKLVDMVSFGQVGKSWDSFKTSIGEAEGFAGKAKAGFSALSTSGLGPLGVAAGVAGFILNGLGQEQQKAAQEAQAHQQRIQTLTQALLANGGAIDSNIRGLAAKALADKEVSNTGKTALEIARESGLSLATLTDAYLGNADAQKTVNDSLDEYAKSMSSAEAGSSAEADNALELKDTLPELNSEYQTSSQRAKDMAAASGEAAAATKAQAKALQELHDEIIAMVDKDFAYRQSVEATTKAQKDATDALKAHGKKSDEYKTAAEGVESAQAKQAQAAYDLALANSVATSEIGKAQDATFAYNQEVLKIAETAGGVAPRSLGLMISKLSETDLSAQGASRSINAAGNEVIRLPNGKTITVNADDRASATITSIANRNYTAVVRLTGQWAGFYGLPSGVVLSGSSAHGNAAGGPVSHAAEGGARTGRVLMNERGLMEGIRTPGGDLVDMESGSSVVPHTNMQSMRASGSGARVEILFGSDGSELGDLMVKLVRRHVRVVGGGDVQVALGGAA
jgi:hypothetical protein